MYSKHAAALITCTALALGACSSLPERVDIYEEARMTVHDVDQDPMAEEVAGAELAQARDALREAEMGLEQNAELAEIRHDSYRALRHAQIVEQRIAEAQAREEIEASEAKRNDIVLRAREREAEMAQSEARVAQSHARTAESAALTAASEARRAQDQARMAETEALSAQAQARAHARDADAARMQAEDARAEARRLEAEFAELQAEQTERGLVLTLGDVFFDTDRAELKPGAHQSLQRLAAMMVENPERRLRIEGHTDARGTDAYNRSLSSRRAMAVQDALISAGVAADRLTIVGLGESFPVASNETQAGRQQNRRVEIVISDSEGDFPGAARRETG